jgi:hypothetical protein
MRTLIGIGTPRGFQGRAAAVLALLITAWSVVTTWCRARSLGPTARHVSPDAINLRACQLVAG